MNKERSIRISVIIIFIIIITMFHLTPNLHHHHHRRRRSLPHNHDRHQHHQHHHHRSINQSIISLILQIIPADTVAAAESKLQFGTSFARLYLHLFRACKGSIPEKTRLK